MPTPKSSQLFLPFFVLIISVPFFLNYRTIKFTPDENLYIKMSLYFDTVVFNGKLEDPNWVNFRSIDQPALGKYIFGFVQTVFGGKRHLTQISQLPAWNFNLSEEQNILSGARPPQEILQLGRLTSVFFGVGCCFLLFLIGKRIFNTFTGVLVAVFLSNNPLMLKSSCRAMTDSLVLFFMALVILLITIFFRLLNHRNWNGALGISFLIGIASALAASTKLNGAISVLIFCLFCLEIIILEVLKTIKSNKKQNPAKSLFQNRMIQTALFTLVISLFTSFVGFVALNPPLYSSPILTSKKMIQHRLKIAKGQTLLFPDSAINGTKNRILTAVRNSLDNSSYSTLHRYLKIPIDLILFLTGLLAISFHELKLLKEKNSLSLNSLVLIWTVISYSSIILCIPLNWNRYYLPVFPCVSLVIAFGVHTLWEYGKTRLTKTF